MDAPLWTEGASPWPHEREALAFAKSHLPNHEPYRAWTNVEFIADDGSVNEIDLLVVTPSVFALVEIKSYPGKLFGDGQRWRNVRPDGYEKLYDHPLLLVNLKAKRLKSLLARQSAFRNEKVPYVTGMVFLSSPELDCRLHSIGRTAVTGRDPDTTSAGGVEATPAKGPNGFAPLPGIVAALRNPALLNLPGTAINKPASKRIADAIEQAGIKPSNRGRRVGDWTLGEQLDEGPGWQDFVGERPGMSVTRRIRVYLAGAATTKEEEARLRREAEREFRLLDGLRHEGIADAKELVQAERGPAVLFDIDPAEQRLDLWASEHLHHYSLEQRVEMVRQLAEALAHAHRHRITHRALTARSVLVRPPKTEGALPQLQIGHWQAGARELATRLTRHTSQATSLPADLAERVAGAEQVYLAPEAFTVEAPNAVALDVFSLGSLAYLLLAGNPPADDVAGRDALLNHHQGLPLGAAVDGLPDALSLMVAAATDPMPANRGSIADLLGLLDDALEELTRPLDLDGDMQPTGVDPLTAHSGDVLEGGWVVTRRLGSGSTAVALLCDRLGSPEPEVLKVAKDESLAERLNDEAKALEALEHACLVRFFGITKIHGRTTLRLAPAGDPDDKHGLTLADRLLSLGKVGLDLLERFGDDLLDVVTYLETMGVAHRDIKPDNLGVRPRRGDRSLHLVLFDLSLTKVSDTSINAGTPGYLDPFLAERDTKRWDPAAERYSAAATMYEMATGVRPRWGDGATDPAHQPAEVPAIDPELFDPSVRDALVAFFTKALHRRPKQRFDTVAQMREAWRRAFRVASRSATTTSTDGHDTDQATLDRLAAEASTDTPVAELGLSSLAVGVLERRGVGTVGQLLAMPVVEWNHAPGIGLRVRREVLEALARLREYVPVQAADGDAAVSIDTIVAQLVPKPTTPQSQADQQPLTYLLGLDSQLRFGVDGDAPAWPSRTDVRAATDLDGPGYDALLERARARWAKQPAMTQLRVDIVTLLDRAGGVLPADEIAAAVLLQRGSTATGAERDAKGRAVLRAALETEEVRAGNRFIWRRVGGGMSAVVALRTDELTAEELADFAAGLGKVADQLAATEPTPPPAVVIDRLRAVAPPAGLAPLADFRLARLAAAASATAAVSSRLEIYRRGLLPERALRQARAALLGAGTLSVDDVHTRVRTRFPAAAPLPQRPQLDELLEAALGLRWYPEGLGQTGVLQPAGYRVPSVEGRAPSTHYAGSVRRHATGAVTNATVEDRVAADSTHTRLAHQATNGGYLVMTVHPRAQKRAIELLTDYGPHVVDVDAWLVDHLRHHATTTNIRWDDAIVAADAAGPEGPRWAKLKGVVRDALAPAWAELLVSHTHVMFTYPGLLGRYHLLGQIDLLRERVRHPEPDQALRTVWLLVPQADGGASPTIDHQPVPFIAGQHLDLPQPWLENLHKTAGAPS